MRVKHHFFIGLVLAAPIMVKAPAGAVTFFMVSFLLDVDHYIFFIFHEKYFILSPLKTMDLYKEWNYFGPRVHFFHNYETLFLVGLCWGRYGGVYRYLLLGVLLHLICDFIPTYHRFHFNRIRSLIGDIFRYRRYLQACKQGREKEFMLLWRNSWWAHLLIFFSVDTVEKIQGECGVLQLYEDVPLNGEVDSVIWRTWY